MPNGTNEHILSVHVTPKSSFDKIVGVEPDQKGNVLLKVKVTCPPEDGLANKSVVRLLSKSLKVAKSNINIFKGHKSRYKQVAINCDDEKYKE